MKIHRVYWELVTNRDTLIDYAVFPKLVTLFQNGELKKSIHYGIYGVAVSDPGSHCHEGCPHLKTSYEVFGAIEVSSKNAEFVYTYSNEFDSVEFINDQVFDHRHDKTKLIPCDEIIKGRTGLRD